MDDMTKMGAVFQILLMIGLFITFLCLQLTGVIVWSWWWVFAPLWIPFVLGIILKICGVEPPK